MKDFGLDVDFKSVEINMVYFSVNYFIILFIEFFKCMFMVFDDELMEIRIVVRILIF